MISLSEVCHRRRSGQSARTCRSWIVAEEAAIMARASKEAKNSKAKNAQAYRPRALETIGS